jgi:hypothetical protein
MPMLAEAALDHKKGRRQLGRLPKPYGQESPWAPHKLVVVIANLNKWNSFGGKRSATLPAVRPPATMNWPNLLFYLQYDFRQRC